MPVYPFIFLKVFILFHKPLGNSKNSPFSSVFPDMTTNSTPSGTILEPFVNLAALTTPPLCDISFQSSIQVTTS